MVQLREARGLLKIARMNKRWLLILPFLTASVANAVCTAGQITTLAEPITFELKGEAGQALNLTLSEGSEVHVLAVQEPKVSLFVSTRFQNQDLTLVSELSSDVIRALNCAKE